VANWLELLVRREYSRGLVPANTQLQGQDQALGELGQGIDEVGDLLPGFGLTVAHLLKMGRFLAWLMAAIFALHRVYLLLSARLGKQFSA
jgi:hypothetical protein